jgi:hypothetical protein
VLALFPYPLVQPFRLYKYIILPKNITLQTWTAFQSKNVSPAERIM